jgi:hypothetical protein
MQPLLRALATDFYWVLYWSSLGRRLTTVLASLGSHLAFVYCVVCLLVDLRTTYEDKLVLHFICQVTLVLLT